MNLHDAAPSFEAERRRQLIEATIEALADVGFKAASLSQIASRANVSTGLFAHYFGDKDGLLEATLRFMAARLVRAMRQRLRDATTARERLYAVPDSALADREFERRTSAVWLAFWGQITHSIRYQRVQIAYQHRMLSNLRHSLRDLVPADCVDLHATMIASMIDGLWIRSHANPTQADAARARAIVRSLIDGLIAGAADATQPSAPPSGMCALAPVDPMLTDRLLHVVNPMTGTVLGSFKAARHAEIERGIKQARSGLRDWQHMTGRERESVLRRCADALRDDGDELARLDTICTGRPMSQTRTINVPRAVQAFERACILATQPMNERIELGRGLFDDRRRVPIGIVAGVGHWSSPLLSACRQAAPALALGNAMVFLAPELAPLTALRLVEIFARAGLPAGVFTVLNGDTTTRRLLVDCEDVKASLAAVERLGRPPPKSATIVFGDAERAARAVLQGCRRWTHAPDLSENSVFVQSHVLSAFKTHLVAHAKHLRMGDPLDPATQIGTLPSADHRDHAQRLIDLAVAAGATRLDIAGRRKKGSGASFLAPTILGTCRQEMPIVRETVFAPVVTLLTFETDDEIVQMIDRHDPETSTGVFDPDVGHARRIANRLRTRFCCINDYDAASVDDGMCNLELGHDAAAANTYCRSKRIFCRDDREADA